MVIVARIQAKVSTWDSDSYSLFDYGCTNLQKVTLVAQKSAEIVRYNNQVTFEEIGTFRGLQDRKIARKDHDSELELLTKFEYKKGLFWVHPNIDHRLVLKYEDPKCIWKIVKHCTEKNIPVK